MALNPAESSPGNLPFPKASSTPQDTTAQGEQSEHTEHFFNPATIAGITGIVGANAADGISTAVLIEKGGGLDQGGELNPIASNIIEHTGLEGLVGAEAVAAIACSALLAYLRSLDMYHKSVNPARKLKWFNTAVALTTVMRWIPTAWNVANTALIYASTHH